MEIREELLSELPAAQNGMFVFFLICFFISMLLLGNSRKLFSLMFRSLFRENDRQSIFSEVIDNEIIMKIILGVQTVLFSAVIVQSALVHFLDIPFESSTRLFLLLGGTFLLIALFFACKFLIQILVSSIFFQKENRQVWENNSFSIISLSGLVLFVPALLMFYWEETYYVGLTCSVLYFLFVEILTSYKIFVIFFQQKSALLYFILYLCAQELVPLFLIYKALVYFYVIM